MNELLKKLFVLNKIEPTTEAVTSEINQLLNEIIAEAMTHSMLEQIQVVKFCMTNNIAFSPIVVSNYVTFAKQNKNYICAAGDWDISPEEKELEINSYNDGDDDSTDEEKAKKWRQYAEHLHLHLKEPELFSDICQIIRHKKIIVNQHWFTDVL